MGCTIVPLDDCEIHLDSEGEPCGNPPVETLWLDTEEESVRVCEIHREYFLHTDEGRRYRPMQRETIARILSGM